MKSHRAGELRASLQRELAAMTQREGTDAARRWRWLIGEIENYLDRWLAFAAFDGVALKSLVHDDLFTMVKVASEVAETQRMGTEMSSQAEAWLQFRAKLTDFESAPHRRKLSELHAALQTVKMR